MQETCATCGEVYTLTQTNAWLFLYIEDSLCNNVESECPKGHRSINYLKAGTACDYMAKLSLSITLGIRASDDIRESAADAWERAHAITGEELPLAPREWMTELYDSLRNWKGEPL